MLLLFGLCQHLHYIHSSFNAGNVCFILKPRIKVVSESNTEILRSCSKGEAPADHQTYPGATANPCSAQAFVCLAQVARTFSSHADIGNIQFKTFCCDHVRSKLLKTQNLVAVTLQILIALPRAFT